MISPHLLFTHEISCADFYESLSTFLIRYTPYTQISDKNNYIIIQDLESKIENYSKILGFISEDSESAILRKKEVEEKISIINSMMNYL